MNRMTRGYIYMLQMFWSDKWNNSMLCCQTFHRVSMIARNVGSLVLDIVMKVQCLRVLLPVLFLALPLFSAYSARAIVIPTIPELLSLSQSYCHCYRQEQYRFACWVPYYGTIHLSSHMHITRSHMRRHSNTKVCAKTTGSTPFINNIVDLALSHMRGTYFWGSISAVSGAIALKFSAETVYGSSFKKCKRLKSNTLTKVEFLTSTGTYT